MYTIWWQMIPTPGGEPSVIAFTNVFILGCQSLQFVIRGETHMIKLCRLPSARLIISNVITLLTPGTSPRVLTASVISLACWMGCFVGHWGHLSPYPGRSRRAWFGGRTTTVDRRRIPAYYKWPALLCYTCHPLGRGRPNLNTNELEIDRLSPRFPKHI